MGRRRQRGDGIRRARRGNSQGWLPANLVIEGETGLSFEVNDASGLARCLAQFLADPTLAPRMGRNAAEHVRKYSIDTAVTGIVQAVRAVTKSKLGV